MNKPDFIPILEWEPSDILSILLLSLLFFWGLFLLYQKWIKKYDYPLWLDLLSLIIMFVILGIELIQLKEWLRDYVLLYILSSLGLFVAATALYAQSFISLITTIFLSLIQPGEESAPNIPRFGPAEILEREKDFIGALNEYFVLARIYPHHSSVHLRIANVYLKMNHPQEAMTWLKKSLQYLKKEEDIYLIIVRYCDIAQEIGDMDSASDMLDFYLTQYPESIHAKSIAERKKKMNATDIKEKKSLLIPMDEEPISETNFEEDESKIKKSTLKIEKIQDEEKENEPEQNEDKKGNAKDKKHPLSKLEPL